MTDRIGRTPRARFVPATAADAAIALGGLLLLGATAFGLWHVVVGGLINGNPRAGAFGVGLAMAAGIPLVLGALVVRRRRPGSAPDDGAPTDHPFTGTDDVNQKVVTSSDKR